MVRSKEWMPSTTASLHAILGTVEITSFEHSLADGERHERVSVLTVMALSGGVINLCPLFAETISGIKIINALQDALQSVQI